jgi:methyl-accepting chemotaxis protein
MYMYISFEDLAIFIVVTVAVVVGVFLIVALKNLISILRKVNKVMDTNKDDIDGTVKALPVTVKNIGDAADSLKNTSDKASAVIGTVDGAVTSTVDKVNGTTENIYEIINVIGIIAKFISDAFKDDD